MTGASSLVYQAFDLPWRSPDLPLPELPATAGAQPDAELPCIRIGVEPPSHWPPLPPGPLDSPWLQMAPGELRFSVQGIGRYRVSGGERIAWWREHEAVSDQEIRTFLLGSAVGALLIQRGLLVLHGNALEREGQAIVCLGHSGAGKSTLAYALMRQGWRLLADDLVAITPEGLVLPGIPRIKLWHDAALAFGLDPTRLAPVRQGIQKYVLMGDAIDPAPLAVPLRALYLIQRSRDGAEAGAGGPIAPIPSQKQAFTRLVNQTYRPLFVQGLGQQGANFLALSALIRRIPIATLRLPQAVNQGGIISIGVEFHWDLSAI